MHLKLLTFVALILALAGPQAIYAQESTTAQKTDAQAAPAAKTAQELEAQLQTELNKPAEAPAATPAVATAPATTPAPAPADVAALTPPPEDPLIEQYKLRKDKNFKSVEFELAKELALQRSSAALTDQEDQLYKAAFTNLTNALGNISEPQKEETYFEYQEDLETGEFVVVLVKDSYVKADRGDLCQIGTQVHLRTSIQSEFSAKLSELTPSAPAAATPAPATDAGATPAAAVQDDAAVTATAPKAPTTVTEIECYNDERPTYSQRVVN